MDLLDNAITKIKRFFVPSTEQGKNAESEKKFTKFDDPKEDEDDGSSNGKKQERV